MEQAPQESGYGTNPVGVQGVYGCLALSHMV